MLDSFLSREFLLQIPCWLHLYAGSFSYTFRAGVTIMWGVSYTSHAGLNFIWGVSRTHPVLASILAEEFLLHIPCWLQFSLGSFSYTSRAGFFFHVERLSYTSRAGFNFI